MAGLTVAVLRTVDPSAIPVLGWAGERLDDDAWEDSIDHLRRYLDDAHISYRFDLEEPPPAEAVGPFLIGRVGAEDAALTAVLRRERRGGAGMDALVIESANIPAHAEVVEPRIVLIVDVEKSRRPGLLFAIVLRGLGASVAFETGEAEWEDQRSRAKAAGADWIVAMDAERLLTRDAAIVKLSDASFASLDADRIRDCFMDLYRSTPMSE
jgi:hypothetical protein